MSHGGNILVQSLLNNNVSLVSCVAGESYLPVLDGLVDSSIKVVTCRHESGASFMAESLGLLDANNPGVVFVTRGPGACNASIGVHAAKQSSSPMVLFVGLIHQDTEGLEAFQEFDIEKMFGAIAKDVFVIRKKSEISDIVSKAFYKAKEGRPGPVVVGLPEDVLFATALDSEMNAARSGDALLEIEIKIKDETSKQNIEEIISAFKDAKKPMILVGGVGWSNDTCQELEAFALNNNLPVVSAFRRQDIFSHTHSCYVGELGTGPNPELLAKANEADLVLILNERVDEITTQSYALFKNKLGNNKDKTTSQKIIHVFPDEDAFDKGCLADLKICSHIGPFLEKCIHSVKLDKEKERYRPWLEECRSIYEEWSDASAKKQSAWDGADMTAIFSFLRDNLNDDAVITTDAGNFSGWAQRYIRYGRPGRLLAPVSGAMGYAVPSALAASIAFPERQVIGICGDGGFLMTGQELATALHHKAKPIIIVCNNGLYGTIRMHQEREYPGRHCATDLSNPDFVKLAESYGAYGALIEDEQSFINVWNDIQNKDMACLLEIKMDPKQITTNS